jgi:hypothetical protein
MLGKELWSGGGGEKWERVTWGTVARDRGKWDKYKAQKGGESSRKDKNRKD